MARKQNESNYTPNLQIGTMRYTHGVKSEIFRGTHFLLLDSYTTYDMETAGTTWLPLLSRCV